ncbi:uncharacterized protein BO97DRAFT_389387 [Aspergillus homomorphus CBS 101889]|uniref:F-box domain-containing protein n=1 Tax=Aspergillus homomorphus (strain CBS 101889) TaxID=1450537 RepID=A0A395HYD0_ASPHC|nr:hypothetical protein BO97DRAFT_389387 [Aspergillus homomorphus CBS 101889]RAL12931.1 hypothetical protein BO97DRAFT_389387 [Aspergillus homomorphus CBS 101889]
MATQPSNIVSAPPDTEPLNLKNLPTELHLQIASYLPYPDALALKHTNRHFYSLVYTGVHLKVDWLVERFERKLECPMEKCSFRTDEAFCNVRVRRIMERRRWHLECLPSPGGCFVIVGRTCQKKKKKDLVSGWLMKERGRVLGREVLVTGLIFLVLNLMWYLCSRLLALHQRRLDALLSTVLADSLSTL